MIISINELTRLFNVISFEINEIPWKTKINKKSAHQEFNSLINYFLSKRITVEYTFCNSYILFLTGLSFKITGFLDILMKTCFEIYKIFFRKRKHRISKKEEIILESLGVWLRKIFDLDLILFPPRYISFFDSMINGQRLNFMVSSICFLHCTIYFGSKLENLGKKSNFFKTENICIKNFNFIFLSKKFKLFLKKIYNHNSEKKLIKRNINSTNFERQRIKTQENIFKKKINPKNFYQKVQIGTQAKTYFNFTYRCFFDKHRLHLPFLYSQFILKKKNFQKYRQKSFLEKNKFLKFVSSSEDQQIENDSHTFSEYFINDFIQRRYFFVLLILEIFKCDQRFFRIINILIYDLNLNKNKLFKFSSILVQKIFFLVSLIKLFRKDINIGLGLGKKNSRKKISQHYSIFRPKI